MTEKHTFVVQKTCPVCGKLTRVVKVRSRLLATQVDNDFCSHYADFNPYYYTIWVCENCGFATNEKRFMKPMPEKHKDILRDFLTKRTVTFGFSEVRSHAEAVASFKLAILFAEMLKAPASQMAGLTLELAWLFRFSEETEKEREMMEKAVQLYSDSFLREHYPIGGMTDMTVIYLISALYYRLGDVEKSTQYLSRIIGDYDSKIQERKLYERARQLWQEIRAIQKEQKKQAEPKE